MLDEGLVTEKECNKRLDKLFPNNPENDDFLYLEWETDIKKAIIYVRTHINYKNFGLYAMPRTLLQESHSRAFLKRIRNQITQI